MTLPKMRTIDEAHAYLLGLDSETGITKYFIRELCRANKIHCIKTGNKYLLNLDDLIIKLNENIAV